MVQSAIQTSAVKCCTINALQCTGVKFNVEQCSVVLQCSLICWSAQQQRFCLWRLVVCVVYYPSTMVVQKITQFGMTQGLTFIWIENLLRSRKMTLKTLFDLPFTLAQCPEPPKTIRFPPYIVNKKVNVPKMLPILLVHSQNI